MIWATPAKCLETGVSWTRLGAKKGSYQENDLDTRACLLGPPRMVSRFLSGSHGNHRKRGGSQLQRRGTRMPPGRRAAVRAPVAAAWPCALSPPLWPGVALRRLGSHNGGHQHWSSSVAAGSNHTKDWFPNKQVNKHACKQAYKQTRTEASADKEAETTTRRNINRSTSTVASASPNTHTHTFMNAWGCIDLAPSHACRHSAQARHAFCKPTLATRTLGILIAVYFPATCTSSLLHKFKLRLTHAPV